jgi:hypothetical protein
MGYYRMLAVLFVMLIFSVVVQGRDLFADVFFAIAYSAMGAALFVGTKWKAGSNTALSIGLMLMFSVAFLSTNLLIDFFSRPVTPGTIFKFSIVISLDVCALFFLRYGRDFRREERKEHRFGPYSAKGEPPS